MTGNVLPLETLYSNFILVNYQMGRVLAGVAPERITTGYSAYQQWIADKIEFDAPQTVSQLGYEDIPYTPLSVSSISTSPLTFTLKMGISEAQKSIINLDYISLMSQLQGYSAGRAVDLYLLYGIFSNPLYSPAFPSTPNTAATTPFVVIPAEYGANTGLTTRKLDAANVALNNNSVTAYNRYTLMNTNLATDLLRDDRFASYFYTADRQLDMSTETLHKYLTVPFRQIPLNSKAAIPVSTITYSPFGGDPVSGCSRTFVVVCQRDALTLNFNKNLQTTVAFNGENLRTSVLSQMIFNSNVNQPKGVVLIEVILGPDGEAFTSA